MASAYAQSYPLEGAWKLESARLNLVENGMSQAVRKLDNREINDAAIPLELTFGNKATLLLQGEEKPLDYTLNDKILSLAVPDNAHTVYTGWLESDTSLVIMSGYKGEAFRANEIRLTYKKLNPAQ
jgi:hypothetical protein